MMTHDTDHIALNNGFHPEYQNYDLTPVLGEDDGIHVQPLAKYAFPATPHFALCGYTGSRSVMAEDFVPERDLHDCEMCRTVHEHVLEKREITDILLYLTTECSPDQLRAIYNKVKKGKK